MKTNKLVEQIGDVKSLQNVAEPIQKLVRDTLQGAIKNALHGTWLGHPLNPVLTDIPVGAWTAALMLLRGFRRLGVFPGGDVGAERGLRNLLGDDDPRTTLEALGPYRGMLYYHLLLTRIRGARPPAAHSDEERPTV